MGRGGKDGIPLMLSSRKREAKNTLSPRRRERAGVRGGIGTKRHYIYEIRNIVVFHN
jgi:hypothetical protein